MPAGNAWMLDDDNYLLSPVVIFSGLLFLYWLSLRMRLTYFNGCNVKSKSYNNDNEIKMTIKNDKRNQLLIKIIPYFFENR